MYTNLIIALIYHWHKPLGLIDNFLSSVGCSFTLLKSEQDNMLTFSTDLAFCGGQCGLCKLKKKTYVDAIICWDISVGIATKLWACKGNVSCPCA
jgi:hypothetical protein